MKRFVTLFIAITTLISSTLLPCNVSAEDETSVIINDGTMGSELFQVEFNGKWGHDQGLPDLFEGGDEHWTSTSLYNTEQDGYPSFTIRFVGSKIALYGHKIVNGGIAEVTLDGEKAGEIDYYNAGRENKLPLFETEVLPQGEHTVTVTATERCNEKSSGTLEMSFDFAAVTLSADAMLPERLSITKDETFLFTDDAYTPEYTVLPSYAKDYTVVWTSDDPDVADVNEKTGLITAVGEGETTVRAYVKEKDTITDSITVTVEDNSTEIEFISWVGDNNYHVYPEDYDKLVRKYTAAKAAEAQNWSGSAWQSDHATSRIDMLTKAGTVKNAELVVSDLVSANDAKIKKDNISMTYLSAVNAITQSDSTDKLIFDVITRDTVRTLKKNQVHCAWVDIYVPEDTPAGTYTGEFYVKADGRTLAAFDYTLEVIGLTLTDPDDWNSQLELWMYPYSAQRYYSGKSSEEYFGITRISGSSPNPAPLHYVYLDKKYEAALESQLELYRQAGGDAITTTVVPDAWNSQTPDPYPSMIKWTKKVDGSFVFDYTDFDYWVELNMKHGIDGQIKVFSMAGIGWGVAYYDEATRQVKIDGSQPGTAGWTKIWTPFLNDFMAHLEEKGWLDITYIAMDERLVEVTTAVIDLVKNTKNADGKTLKISCAINNMTELAHLFDQIDDLSIYSGLVDSDDSAIALSEERRNAGLITTLYTCGGGNVVTYCDPAEAAHAVYKAYQFNTDGVLRWAFDAFNADPHTSTYHTLYCPGDIYLIYPDKPDSDEMQAMSTPRYEKYTEGLRDVEKMKILREYAPELDDAIDTLMNNMGSNLEVDAIKVHGRIAELSKGALLLSKQYTDVDTNGWYKNAVRFAMANNLMNGVSADRFSPNGSMTRAMFVTVLARLDGVEVDNSATSVFTDVPSGQWYTGSIAWATKNGLLYGVGNNKFDPNGILTREQTATLLYRYASRKKYDVDTKADLTGYKDYDKIGSYALDAISWTNAMGIIKGVSANSLDPRGNCTRAQVAEMLRLFCSNVINKSN